MNDLLILRGRALEIQDLIQIFADYKEVLTVLNQRLDEIDTLLTETKLNNDKVFIGQQLVELNRLLTLAENHPIQKVSIENHIKELQSQLNQNS